MYVHIFGYLVNKLEIWWVYLSPIEKKRKKVFRTHQNLLQLITTHENSGKLRGTHENS